MKKIGLITIIDYNNYGNRLQNYAAQEVLKNLQFEVETILNVQKEQQDDSQLNKENRESIFKKITYQKLKNKILKEVKAGKIKEASNRRKNAFVQFSKDNIIETNFTISENVIPKDINEKYDYFVVGSDQVWNPIFRSGSSIDFLTFANQKKRIAYSPSFGIAEIPDKYKVDYAKWINEFHALSVREDSGAKIIKELTNRDAQVLVDPTLMLSSKQWEKVAQEHIYKPKQKYLLTYFLGDLDKEKTQFIERVAKKRSLKIVHLGKMLEEDYYTAGPSEFIDYIKDSSLFITDSFHGAVFSIIFKKNFYVMERKTSYGSMNSRIETLLKKFYLENRVINSSSLIDVSPIDYSGLEPILNNEQQKALNFLSKALV